MAEKIILGKNGNWGVKENGLLAFNDEDGVFKAIEMDFSRSSTATRESSAGLIAENKTGVPRIDFSDSSDGALLLEPQSTNLIPYSEEFDNAAWLQSNVSVTENSVVSPKGDLTADKIIATSTSGVHSVRDSLSSVTGDYTQSVFVKKGEYKNVLFWDDTLSTGVGINLDDFSVFRTQGTFEYEIESFENDWYRVSVTRAYSAEVPAPAFYIYDNSATPQLTFAGDDVGGIYLWGAQLEEQSYPTSYIPTSGATATRIAESCSKSGLENYINSSEGVLYAEFETFPFDSTDRFISLSDGSLNNRVIFYLNKGADNLFTSQVIVGGVAQAIMSDSSFTLTQFNKVALKYKENDFALWVNGVEVATDSSGSTFSSGTLTRLAFDRGTDVERFVGKVKDLRVYDVALSDSELQTLTTL